eukprot:CAMPEP_0185015446 /NCGR_PEP_ID=MMETSP1098-20130426/99839_1 /TAXON_ID=89044 /ORGANISM="Spumella elongata, Strain CCAP 955/1" /LENGTH=812 /DNA_ID=CAMNT_0027544573 /DNA_START=32 /DNA_END=2467 /DNA_ORIENTATION=+
MPAGSPSIFATLSFNGFFFVSIMLMFEYYRNKVVDIYAPRSRGKYPKSVQPREGIFQWFFQIYELDDYDMFKIAGMDGYVFLRFLKFCCKVCTVTSILAGLILIPVYYSGPGNGVYGIDAFSMANIKPNGHRLWASVVFAYLFTLIFLYLIHEEYEHFVIARKKFFDGQDEIIPVQVHYTVQVENIPAEYQNSQKLYELFESIFPNEVLFAHVAVSTPRLDVTINKLHTARAQLECAIAAYEASHRTSRPTLYLRKIKRSLMNADKEVDAMIYLTSRVERLAARVAKLQVESSKEPSAYIDDELHFHDRESDLDDHHERESLGSFSTNITDDDAFLLHANGYAFNNDHAESWWNMCDKRHMVAFFHDVRDRIVANFVSATGFVTFRTRRAQVSAVRMPILVDKYPRMVAQPAAAPNDVIWGNMSAPLRHTEDVAYFTAAAYYCGLFFWSLVMAFIAALSNVSTLERYLPFMNHMNGYVYAILQGILPVVVMLSFSIFMTNTISFISRDIEKRKTHSAVEQQVFKWYFMYQIANIYLLLFAGSIWDSLSEAIENPKAIVSLISAALPKVSIFFVNYIITIWLSGVPYKMIRRFCAVQYLYYRCFTRDAALTRRMLKNPIGPFGETRVAYGTELSDVLYVLCVVMLYWVIAPIVLILAAGLFWSWYITWKYQYVFVITRTFESGGQFWYKLYRYSMLGLMAGTIVFMAFMGIKEGVSQGPLLVPLPIIIYMSWRYTERRFKAQSQNLAFGSALKQERSTSAGDLPSMSHSAGGSSHRAGHSGQSDRNETLFDDMYLHDESGTSIDAHHEPERSH